MPWPSRPHATDLKWAMRVWASRTAAKWSARKARVTLPTWSGGVNSLARVRACRAHRVVSGWRRLMTTLTRSYGGSVTTNHRHLPCGMRRMHDSSTLFSLVATCDPSHYCQSRLMSSRKETVSMRKIVVRAYMAHTPSRLCPFHQGTPSGTGVVHESSIGLSSIGLFFFQCEC